MSIRVGKNLFLVLVTAVFLSGCTQSLQNLIPGLGPSSRTMDQPRASLSLPGPDPEILRQIKASPKPEARLEQPKPAAMKKSNEPDIYTRPGAVAPGFQLKITNLEDEKLSGEYRVDYDGNLKLPYGVTIKTRGLTETQLKKAIIQAYSRFFTVTPKMQVSITSRDYWVDVRGLVVNSGKFLVKQDTSLDEILAKAGGLQKDPNAFPLARYVRIKQPNGDTAFVKLGDYYSGVSVELPNWQGGDSIFAQTEVAQASSAFASPKSYIQLLGQVNEPGQYRFQNNADFFYYLVKAGGPTAQADLGRLTIVRTVGLERQTFDFDIQDPSLMPQIENGDILIVNSGIATRQERELERSTNLASIFSSIGTVLVLALAL